MNMFLPGSALEPGVLLYLCNFEMLRDGRQ